MRREFCSGVGLNSVMLCTESTPSLSKMFVKKPFTNVRRVNRHPSLALWAGGNSSRFSSSSQQKVQTQAMTNRDKNTSSSGSTSSSPVSTTIQNLRPIYPVALKTSLYPNLSLPIPVIKRHKKKNHMAQFMATQIIAIMIPWSHSTSPATPLVASQTTLVSIPCPTCKYSNKPWPARPIL
jgi:hypothetical protein